jgi:hypothetical protein
MNCLENKAALHQQNCTHIICIFNFIYFTVIYKEEIDITDINESVLQQKQLSTAMQSDLFPS